MIEDIDFLESNDLKYEYLNRKEAQNFLSIENNNIISVDSRKIEEKALRIIDNERVALSFGSGDIPITKLVENCISSLNYSRTIKKDFRDRFYHSSDNVFERTNKLKNIHDLFNTGNSISCDMYSLFKNNFNINIYCWLDNSELNIRNYRNLNVTFKDQTTNFFIRATERLTNNTYGLVVYNEDNFAAISDFNKFLELSLIKSNILPGKSYTTILHPRIMRNIVLPIWKGFNRLTIKSDTTILDLYKKISPKITLYEGPHDKRVNGFSPFDHEGSPTTELNLIDKGYVNASILENEFIDRTGSYFKKDYFTYKFKISMQPTLFPSSFRIEEGNVPINELVCSIKEGIFIVDSPNLWQNIDLNGNMNGTIGIGYKISNGKLVGSLSGLNFSMNAYEVLGKSLVEISDCPEIVCQNSDIMPYILTSGVYIL